VIQVSILLPPLVHDWGHAKGHEDMVLTKEGNDTKLYLATMRDATVYIYKRVLVVIPWVSQGVRCPYLISI
jgi:hypothetical protein